MGGVEFKGLSDIRLGEREEESMPRFLAGVIGRVVGRFWEPQTTEKEQGQRFCFEPGQPTNAEPSGNGLDICLFAHNMRMASCAPTYLTGLRCRTDKIKNTQKCFEKNTLPINYDNY